MLEAISMFLFALWVIALVTGNNLSGAIHILLVGGLIAAYLHHRAVANARSLALMASSRSMANAMGVAPKARKPIAPKKAEAGPASRPSAAA